MAKKRVRSKYKKGIVYPRKGESFAQYERRVKMVKKMYPGR